MSCSRLPPPSPTPRSPAGLVVELCGLPGAGKTTIANALAELLRRDGVQVTVVDERVSAAVPRPLRIVRKARAAARVLAAAPFAESRAARVLGRGQTRPRDMVAVPVQWWVTKRLLVEGAASGGVAVLEEGLVQGLWTAGLHSQRTSSVELVRLASHGVLPDVVVHVDVSPHEAVERLRARRSRHSRVQQLPQSEQLTVMRHGQDLLRELLDEWRGRELSDIVVVHGDGEERVVQLADALRGGSSAQPRRRMPSPG